MGYDVHRLVENRKLILGGVEIPYEKGLLGHSDADVLLHAIMDALLGAAFPPQAVVARRAAATSTKPNNLPFFISFFLPYKLFVQNSPYFTDDVNACQ